MSRIDIKTLVLAFENRISKLERNPPDKVSTGVILSLLEQGIEEVIKGHFLELIKQELEKRIKTEFKEMKDLFIDKTITNILTDQKFREKLESEMKSKIMRAIQ